MKKIVNITLGLAALSMLITSCADVKRDPGRIYMPDMTYSRAYESYAERDTTLFTTDKFDKGGNKIYFNASPVAGTVKRGQSFAYTVANDSTGYKLSSTVQNPFKEELAGAELEEISRLYNINCGICHGEKAAGNGPLSTGGKIGGVANLTLPNYIAMADGTMFHSIEYGKGVMGSYASQLSREQRWKIVKYIRILQGGAAPAAAADSTATAAK
jgi:mono/diheme cytochrome c family protein